jgi:hypothetical protein
LLIADDREHPLGVDRRDACLARAHIDDDVAGQKRAELRFGRECLVRERRIAGTEDRVRLSLDAELLLQRRLHVDLAEDAEARRLQFASHTLDSLGKRQRRRFAQRVAGCKHWHSSSR